MEIKPSVSGICGKLKPLYERKMYDIIAHDLVAVNMNKFAAAGKLMKGFSCYLGMNSPEIIESLKNELANYGCELTDCKSSDANNIEISATAIGDTLYERKPAESGNIIIAFKSSGLHTSGFSRLPEIKDEYLTPTFNYYNEVIDLFEKGLIKDAIPITHGIEKGLKKIITQDMMLNFQHIPEQKVFTELKEIFGNNIYNYFNGGVGFCIITDMAHKEFFSEQCAKYEPFVIGYIK